MRFLDRALDTDQRPPLDPETRLLQAALSLLANNGQTGGVHGLTERFQEAGLGHLIRSWIEPGPNLPMSAQQVEQVLGDGPLEQIAEETGFSQEEAADHLSRMLPRLVDRLTPEGHTPQSGLGNVSALLERVMGRY